MSEYELPPFPQAANDKLEEMASARETDREFDPTEFREYIEMRDDRLLRNIAVDESRLKYLENKYQPLNCATICLDLIDKLKYENEVHQENLRKFTETKDEVFAELSAENSKYKSALEKMKAVIDSYGTSFSDLDMLSDDEETLDEIIGKALGLEGYEDFEYDALKNEGGSV